MKLFPLFALATLTATPVLAEDTRHLGTHEHGVGQLDIALDGSQIAMELHAPGADIVGFEYAATAAEDLAVVDAAIATLSQPLELFDLPEAADCNVVQAAAALESEGAHDDHGDDHAEKDEHGHDDYDKDEHAHDEDHHDKEAHDDAEHHDEGEHDEEHEEAAGHTEFHAEYLLTCTTPSAITEIDFTYFAAFPNALEVEVQLISDAGATSFEVERDAPILDLSGKF